MYPLHLSVPLYRIVLLWVLHLSVVLCSPLVSVYLSVQLYRQLVSAPPVCTSISSSLTHSTCLYLCAVLLCPLHLSVPLYRYSLPPAGLLDVHCGESLADFPRCVKLKVTINYCNSSEIDSGIYNLFSYPYRIVVRDIIQQILGGTECCVNDGSSYKLCPLRISQK